MKLEKICCVRVANKLGSVGEEMSKLMKANKNYKNWVSVYRLSIQNLK